MENKAQKRIAFLEVAQNPSDKLWYWCLWSANGRQLAQNPIPYASAVLATAAARSVRQTVTPGTPITISKDAPTQAAAAGGGAEEGEAESPIG